MSEALVSLDIGTSKIRAIVAERLQTGALQVTGVGVANSEGLRRGDVVNIEKTVDGIKTAIQDAEYMSGYEIKECSVSIGGIHIEGFNSTGVVPVSDKQKGNREVDASDIENVIKSAKAVEIASDREFIHVIPQNFSVDSQKNLKDPTNQIGVRLEANVHIITGSGSAIEKIVQCVNRSNLNVSGIMYQGLCAVRSVMTNDESELGSILIDIGGATTNVVVMKGGAPTMSFAIPVGGEHLTKDLSVVEGIPFDSAEKIKISDGCCWLDLVDDEDEILVESVAGKAPSQISKRKVCEIFQVRVHELFLIIKNRIEQNMKLSVLKGSIIFCGGGSLLSGIIELATHVFGISSIRLGIPSTLGGLVGNYRNPDFAVVVGLLLEKNESKNIVIHENRQDKNKTSVVKWFKKKWNDLF
ncbi:MAG: cell division protein FtsA [Spirochaetaceae bacterium]|nr:cell division protein FtsA [Spirochaetaceae bacterium]